MLAADASRSFAHLDRGKFAHRDQRAGSRFHPKLPDGADAVALRFRKPKRQLKPPLAFVDICRRLAADSSGDDLLHVGHIDAEAGDLLPVDIDGEVGLAGNLFDLDIFDAVDLLHQSGNLLRLVVQHIKILSEQLDSAFCPDAGDQFVHPLLNRLAHQHGNTRNLCEFPADRIGQLRLGLRRLPGATVMQ